MAEQHARTAPAPNVKIARQAKPESSVSIPAIDSIVVERLLNDPLTAQSRDVLAAQQNRPNA